jgi:hypothetical protein
MSVPTENLAGTIAIPPFQVKVAEVQLVELRRWVKKVYPNLVYFSEVDRGGHFAASEEP